MISDNSTSSSMPRIIQSGAINVDFNNVQLRFLPTNRIPIVDKRRSDLGLLLKRITFRNSQISHKENAKTVGHGIFGLDSQLFALRSQSSQLLFQFNPSEDPFLMVAHQQFVTRLSRRICSTVSGKLLQKGQSPGSLT
ncbi:hypothetical protein ES332_D12G246700v1 [Gossypium tomentosum]|uniref:Uncharacterized protein n=1 Tax=Gossypium tomentosum TaxID=34277 RepID=A0A5D2IDE4_GOSTO|nr:hypothetical protein ES332_D12G246700v1 [Gossypium tomentosum]